MLQYHLFRIHTSLPLYSNNIILIINLHKILKFIKFYSYKVKLVQKLNDDDPDRRLKFCDLMMKRLMLIPTSYLTSFFPIKQLLN